jgi:hypothetical protein
MPKVLTKKVEVHSSKLASLLIPGDSIVWDLLVIGGKVGSVRHVDGGTLVTYATGYLELFPHGLSVVFIAPVAGEKAGAM